MTNKKRLFEMKKELAAIKKVMDKEWRKADKYERFVRPVGEHMKIFKDISQYYFITKQGIAYSIWEDSVDFPNINISDVVYIKKTFSFYTWKKNNKRYETPIKFTDYDTLKGYFNMKSDFNYDKKICERFNVTETCCY